MPDTSLHIYIRVKHFGMANITFATDLQSTSTILRTIVPQIEVVKYLRLHFNCKLNWKEHIARKRKQIDLKTKEINWLMVKKKIPSNYRKQIIHLQRRIQTYRELRNRTVGLRQKVQHSHHAKISIQNSQSHSKYTLVCNTSYSTYRLHHPLCK